MRDQTKAMRAARRTRMLMEGSLSIWTGKGSTIPSKKRYSRKDKHPRRDHD